MRLKTAVLVSTVAVVAVPFALAQVTDRYQVASDPNGRGYFGFGSSPSSGQADRLQTVRICGVKGLDRRAGECTRDESGSALLSSAFH